MVAPMNRPESSTERLFESLSRLRAKWPKGGWSWDNRFGCVASSFGIDLVPDARAALREALVNEWTMRTISGAPPVVREVAESTGGIRPDQLLFSSDPAARVLSYGLWWPWGDDITISLRIGLSGYASESENYRFRSIFDAFD
jgi:hypothetical protein